MEPLKASPLTTEPLVIEKVSSGSGLGPDSSLAKNSFVALFAFKVMFRLLIVRSAAT